MRNISFALTTEQIRDRSKTVTRRLGWKDLKPGTLLQPVVKGMGLRKGERVEKIGGPIRVRMVTQEWISAFLYGDPAHMKRECMLEGFPMMTPREFYQFFRTSHGDYDSDDLLVQRIEFEYVEEERQEQAAILEEHN